MLSASGTWISQGYPRTFAVSLKTVKEACCLLFNPADAYKRDYIASNLYSLEMTKLAARACW
jgi:hypothetical protein